MRYSYQDSFITKDIAPDEIEAIENEAIKEINRLNVSDEYYFQKLVITKVYMELCKLQFEDETIQKKYNLYKDEFEKLLRVSKKSAINNIKLGRG